MLYLNPRGKTNSAQDRNIWRSSNINESKRPVAELNEKFYYGSVNGWMVDNEDNFYLKLNQQAGLEIKDFNPFRTDPTGTDGRGLTVELDFMINGILDYEKPLISCLSKISSFNDNIAVGF
jgi:hypothetical protein